LIPLPAPLRANPSGAPPLSSTHTLQYGGVVGMSPEVVRRLVEPGSALWPGGCDPGDRPETGLLRASRTL